MVTSLYYVIAVRPEGSDERSSKSTVEGQPQYQIVLRLRR